MPSSVRTRRIGRATVVSAAGPLDLQARRHLRTALAEPPGGDDDPVLVDLTEARAVGATAIAVLLNAHRRYTRDDRQLSLVVPPGPVRRVIELARLLDTFTTHRTLDAALNAAAAGDAVRKR